MNMRTLQIEQILSGIIAERDAQLLELIQENAQQKRVIEQLKQAQSATGDAEG